MKLILKMIRELLSEKKRALKLYYHRALWRENNSENRTIANTVFDPSLVQVGIGSYGHLNIHSYGSEGEKLVIGNYCSIAGGVHFILGGQHNYKRFSTYPFRTYFGDGKVDATTKGPIIIEDDVWIGYGSIILSGVKIGKGAVIAAGSVVFKDVPSYAIWAGDRVKRFRFNDDVIKRIKAIDYSSINKDVANDVALLNTSVNSDNVDTIVNRVLIKGFDER